MNQQIKNIDESVVMNTILRMLQFQRKWRLITMFFYVVTTVGTILCSTGATILGALDMGQQAAILAAIATIFVSTEKSFLFREKWKLHLTIESQLRSIKLDNCGASNWTMIPNNAK
jgi:multidrug transporter EmrE-like cation transporter